MRILVTGSRGQLGYDVCRELQKRRIAYCAASSQDMDITKADSVRKKILAYRPEAVIHCAAYTAVDRAEDEPGLAFAVNEGGTKNIAESCEQTGAKMIYISTDYVFPGTGTQAYEADAPAGPLNVYGQSKLAGELAVKESLRRYFIVRTSWVFGVNGNNFVKTMLQLSETRGRVRVVDDQVGSPTYTVDLASLLCDMVQTEKYGVYHASNEGECSWAEFARAVYEIAGRPTVVEPVETEAYMRTKARRPKNSRLGRQSLIDAGFSRLPCWQDALLRYLQEMNDCGTGRDGKNGN